MNARPAASVNPQFTSSGYTNAAYGSIDNNAMYSNVDYNSPYSNVDYAHTNPIMRDATTISTTDVGFQKVLDTKTDVKDQTLYQVDIENESLLRQTRRSELANKNQLLTRRWQPALVSGLVLVALAGSIGGLAYWISLPKVITQPYLLYGDTCTMNSRSCDATRQLWCPAGKCTCTGNYQWNTTAQNCSCGAFQTWNGITCKGYGSYGDPCNSVPCLPLLTCKTVINQTYTTGQSICDCDNSTYLDTNTVSVTYRKCVSRLGYGSICQTKNDCQNWLGLSCTNATLGVACQCDSTSFWNGSICVQQARGGDPCSYTIPIPCDTTRGLFCSNATLTCQCDQSSFWDNVTTFLCQSKKTYGISCQYGFQCNTTVNLSCPAISTGCNCPISSSAYICDCLAGYFWDGQRCSAQHIFNGTCPGQYACSANLVCYYGHCICPGNMVWNLPASLNTCACANGTWNTVSSTCI